MHALMVFFFDALSNVGYYFRTGAKAVGVMSCYICEILNFLSCIK